MSEDLPPIGAIGLPDVPEDRNSEIPNEVKSYGKNDPIYKHYEKLVNSDLPLEDRIEVVPFYFVCVRNKDGSLSKMGQMWNMGNAHGTSFPEFAPLLGEETEEDAETLKGKIIKYIRSITKLPIKKRPGSSKHWLGKPEES